MENYHGQARIVVNLEMIYIEDNVIYVNWKARYEIISDNYINDYDHYLDDDGSRYKLESFLYGIPY